MVSLTRRLKWISLFRLIWRTTVGAFNFSDSKNNQQDDADQQYQSKPGFLHNQLINN